MVDENKIKKPIVYPTKKALLFKSPAKIKQAKIMQYIKYSEGDLLLGIPANFNVPYYVCGINLKQHIKFATINFKEVLQLRKNIISCWR